MPEPVAFTYRAFLSYSHRDNAWATWLHRALENTKIDKDLVGRPTPVGPVPASLRPVFRDRDDFSAGHSLTAQTIAALEGSQFLVAICSPNAARSIYVNEEIRRFKAMGRGDRIIPLIVDGEPGDPQRECFPPAIRFKLDPDGNIGTEHEEPIAADARPQGDGKAAALVKITAGLLGVRLDEIIRRAERAAQRQRRFRLGLAGAFVALLVAGSGGIAWGYSKSLENDGLMDEIVRVASGFVSDATDMSDRLGIPAAAPLALITRADAALNTYISKGKDSPKLRHRRAMTLLELAKNYAKLGQSSQQVDRAQDARGLLEALVTADPRNPALRHDLANAYTAVADVRYAQGASEDALAQYRKSLVLREALAKEQPNNSDIQRELTVSYERIGDMLLEQGDPAGAAEIIAASLAIRETLAAAAPSDLEAQRDLAVAYSRAGDIAEHRGALAEAVRRQQTALAISKRLVEAKPANATYLRDLGLAHDTLAKVLVAQAELDKGFAEFQAARALRQRLAATDPTNAIWQRDLSISHEYIGNVHAIRGALREAVEEYRAAYSIRERLAAVDPKNMETQRDLAVARARTAAALSDLGNAEEALALQKQNLAAREKLVAFDGKNVLWHIDLSLTHEAIASLLVKRGAYEEALTHFAKRIVLVAPLAAADDKVRRSLGYTHMKIGDAHRAQGATQRAVESYRASLALRGELAAAHPDETALQLEMIFARWALADLDDDAAVQLRTVVGTLRRLAASSLLNPQQARLLPMAEAQFAKLVPQ